MKLEDIKEGMRVVPHGKTAGRVTWEQFKSCVFGDTYNNFIKYGYLIINKIKSKGIIELIGSDTKIHADFHASDFDPYIEKLTQFEIGKTYRVKTWEQLEKEATEKDECGGLEGLGIYFSPKMIKFCGKSFEATKIYTYSFDGWIITPEMCDLVDEPVKDKPAEIKTYNLAFVSHETRQNYLFAVPADLNINKGDKVLCNTMNGEALGKVTSLITVVEEQLQPLIEGVGAYLPLKKIIGKVEYSKESHSDDIPF